MTTSDSKLQSVLGAVGAAVITIDAVGAIVDYNSATTQLFGYAAGEIIGENVRMLMPEPYRSEHDGYIRNHLDTGVERIIGIGRQVTGLHKSGNTFPIHLSVAKYQEDGATFFTGIIHDLSELARANSHSLRLGQIVEASANEVYVFDQQSLRFVSANRAALQNLGYSHGELCALTPTEIVSDLDPQALRRTLARVKSSATGSVQLATTLRRKDGSLYEGDASLHASDVEQPAVYLAIVQDVTEKNQLRKTLNRNQKIESLGNLTGGIAHDFNNILTVVMGNLELLQETLHSDDDIELVQEAREAAEMGARLTRRLLTFASRGQLAPRRMVANALIDDLTEMLSRTIGSGIRLCVELEAKLWAANLDISELENALVNLVINARDAMPDGGDLTIKTRNCTLANASLQTGEVEPGDYVCISVTDTGTGIADDIRERIFEPFVTSKPASIGSGLGLSMVYGFVRQSGGGIDVESQLNQGTTFSLYLPRAITEEQTEYANDGACEPAPRHSGRTILVAEDDEQVRRLTVRRLEKMGHTVVAAEDGYSALEIYRRGGRFDLLFSDIAMTEGMSGYDLALAARAINAAQPVLLTSGYADSVIGEEKLLQSGFLLIRKPYQQSDLQKVLDDIFSPR